MRRSNDGLWAVIPVKRLTLSKQRLRGVMDEGARAELARVMLEDVLAALVGTSDLAGIRLVSSDTTVAALGQCFGAETITDQLEAGMNCAIQQGIASLPNGCCGVLALPGDIPFADPAELKQAASAVALGYVVIVPALRDEGTNLLGIPKSAEIRLHFGHASFARHLAAARFARFPYRILYLRGIGHDVDVETDLVPPDRVGAGIATRAFLNRRFHSGDGWRHWTRSLESQIASREIYDP